MIDTCKGTLRATPKKITFANLKDTINFCHDKLIKKVWNEKNIRVYGAVNCNSEKGQDNINEYADNYFALLRLD